mmetsp:Transcript_36081/g.88903  ORF Transcript_36081/g.88903 Transcript_36081/m.88903 type:complete len:265 (+) Transcript_36081:1576-2370(+)
MPTTSLRSVMFDTPAFRTVHLNASPPVVMQAPAAVPLGLTTAADPRTTTASARVALNAWISLPTATVSWHTLQRSPSPKCPGGQAPHVRAVAAAGAGESVHITPGKHGLAVQPSASTHDVAPVPTVPPGHGPQELPPPPPASGMHATRKSQPPRASGGSSQEPCMTRHPLTPSPRWDVGHAPQVRPPTVLLHVTRGSHPPFVTALHSSTSVQLTPSPWYPAGHAPQLKSRTTPPALTPPACCCICTELSVVHTTPGKHGSSWHA